MSVDCFKIRDAIDTNIIFIFIIIFVLFLASKESNVFFVLIYIIIRDKGDLKLAVFLLSSFGIGLKGSGILNILFSYFIIALFFRHLLRRLQSHFVPLSLSVLKFGVVLGGGGG